MQISLEIMLCVIKWKCLDFVKHKSNLTNTSGKHFFYIYIKLNLLITLKSLIFDSPHPQFVFLTKVMDD